MSNLTFDEILRVKNEVEKNMPKPAAAVVCSCAAKSKIEEAATIHEPKTMLFGVFPNSLLGMQVFTIADLRDDESLVFETVAAAVEFVDLYERVKRHAPATARAFLASMVQQARRS